MAAKPCEAASWPSCILFIDETTPSPQYVNTRVEVPFTFRLDDRRSVLVSDKAVIVATAAKHDTPAAWRQCARLGSLHFGPGGDFGKIQLRIWYLFGINMEASVF